MGVKVAQKTVKDAATGQWVGSGKWRAVASSDGRRKYSTLFPSKREAEIHARQWRQTLAATHGKFPTAAPPAPLFKDLAEAWLDHVAVLRSIRPGTVVNYRGFVEGHLLGPHGFGALTITEVTPQKIREFIATMRATGSVKWPGRGLSQASLRVGLAALRLLLAQAAEDGHLDVSPLSKMGTVMPRRAGEDKKKIEPFTRDELRRIFAAADARDETGAFGTLVRLWAGSGLRRGEVIGLQGADVDVATGLLSVRRTVSRDLVGPPKTASSVRVVSCLYPVSEEGAAWEPGTGDSRLLLARLRRIPTAIDPGAYFFGRQGRPVSRHQIEYDWRCALVAAGVPHRAPENLRHTWISLLLSRGGNLLKLQKAGGWASATVLLTHYAAAEPDASDAPEAESALPARSLSAK